MKKSLFKKAVFSVIVLFLVATMLAPTVLTTTANAAKVKEEEKVASFWSKEKNIKTYKNKREVIRAIREWGKAVDQRDGAEELKLKKEKIENVGKALAAANKSVPGLIKNIKDIGDGGDFDVSSCISNVTDLVSGVAACIPPWGTVVSVGIDFFKSVVVAVMGGEEGPTAEALMEDRLNQRIDEVSDQLSEMHDQLSALSDEINASTETIISSVSGIVEIEADKENIRDFMISSGKYDFSYRQLRNYLFGSTDPKVNINASTAYYGHLIESITSGDHTSEELKYYYDELYSGLIDNREAFYDAVVGDGVGKSIVAAYYDVLSSDPKLTEELGLSAELAAIQFAFDLYQTELQMTQAILECSNYQYMQMLIHDEDEYIYGSGKVIKNSAYSEAGEYLYTEELMIEIDAFRMQFAKDIAYILGICESYVVEDDEEFYYLETTEINGAVYAKVLEGQKVYLNSIPDSVADLFDLRSSSYEYQIKDGILNETGIIEIKTENIEDTVNLVYYDTDNKGYSVGSIRFTDASVCDFSGGDGSEEFPYLISNAQQFLNIAGGMDKHYMLTRDIDFYGMEINPIGYYINNVGREEYKEFNGVIYGNGYTLSNLTVKAKSNAGIFGKIGYKGIVCAVNFTGITVNANISNAPATSSTFTGGIVAGVNNGTIQSCIIDGCNLKAESNTNNEGAERSVFLKYGCVAGTNSNLISVVYVKNSTIDVDSTHSFGGAETKHNINNVFVGGICGTCLGKIEYAGVDATVVLDAFAKSKHDNDSVVYPYLKAVAAAITTDEDLNFDGITNVYTAVSEDKLRADKKIEANLHGSWYKNAQAYTDDFIPGKSDDDYESKKTTAEIILGEMFVKETYDVEITDTTQIYEVGETDAKILDKIEGEKNPLVIKVNSKEVESFQVVDLYGFTTYNKSFDETAKVEDIQALFFATIGDETVLLTGTFSIEVGKNYYTAMETYNYQNQYVKDEAVQTENVSLKLTDANDEYIIENEACIEVTNAESATAEIGRKTIVLNYEGVSFETEIEVICNVHYKDFDYKDTEKYTYIESVSATCQNGGYDKYKCNVCGEEILTNRTGPVNRHNLYHDVSKEATCYEAGVRGAIYCTWCEEVFVEEAILPRLEHKFVNTNDPDKHSCTVCERNDFAHEYVVTESLEDGVVTYTYICRCGYISKKQDTNIITKDEMLRPTVIVSNGYALAGGDLVTVYVDLKNNPGVNGATLGIRYDERLELVEWYEGDFFENFTVSASHAVNCGYNYAWAKESTRLEKNGNLLKLVFRVPVDATVDDVYSVSVVYTMMKITSESNGEIVSNESSGGFTLPEDVALNLGLSTVDPVKFITKDGVIRLVDRLPGDVNNDGVVNLLDALYLSNCEVNGTITDEIKRYGDVNLSGEANNTDVVKILQAISGGYGASLLSPEYYVKLNTNGYFGYEPETDEEKALFSNGLFVQLYGENNTYAALAQIEKYMQQREGYKFLGWYTRLEGEVDNETIFRIDDYLNTLVRYDHYQRIQTLYARWEKNAVTFDVGDATSGPIDKEIYLDSDPSEENNEHWIILGCPEEEYIVRFTDPEKTQNNVEKTMFRLFDHWEVIIDGVTYKYNAGDAFPLHTANMGEVKFVACWGEWQLEFPALEKKGYDSSFITWYTSNNLYETTKLGEDPYEIIRDVARKGDNTVELYAEWTKPYTYTVVYDSNGFVNNPGAVANSAHSYDEEKQLNNNEYVREYNVTFDYGWNGQSKQNVSIKHKFSGWDFNGKKVTMSDNSFVSADGKVEDGEVITVYANWDTQKMTLLPYNIRPGFTFLGWYDANGKPMWYDTNGNPIVDAERQVILDGEDGPFTLYAKWEGHPYAIKFDENRPSNATGNVDNVPGDIRTSNGDDVTLPSAPYLIGWEFTGWYRDSQCTDKVGNANQKLIKAELTDKAEITLYAGWKAKTIKVNFDVNGGSSSITPIYLTVDQPYGELPVPIRDEYEFLGWCVNDNIVDPNAKVLSYEHTLKAQWLKISDTVVLSVESGDRPLKVGSVSRKEQIITDLDFEILRDYGYSAFKINVTFNAMVSSSSEFEVSIVLWDVLLTSDSVNFTLREGESTNNCEFVLRFSRLGGGLDEWGIVYTNTSIFNFKSIVLYDTIVQVTAIK